ncbi:aspartate--tRNA ligase [Tuwongella immobilis]|uniref:Aspartate--tRNA(Asp/Asn) ligase n=1 Tax=Tuwongella immobilis TaxID=692036 RepID=A0A6C2YM53_9BACT|nr:aspartate--tRNA ligase [Tuwongella immobilis]VIP02444.1 aspartyl-trna synthetase : Aspartate--tRNA(Asp/Asn) ligase OS=Singulisphaera acidiphila (strain ATCC BAA-1392 / DSM 18658 / VKM B-2454 / MOB10) GN=aspS PE=3 SV=1: tRNA_anti-codon: tRNA-synt_2: GAD [Tuwongella immobilis]VTS01416.1 aspartyl-trna synthetase : Aspartate--tRNA(Asp/Asn) ligase OS=Singulisphaera acidiphila (strain ATCC BAA-1392 / DSM 18658 / VKM B-2454 / MOB10) GN=aspS PE=3 SV=1: tRNA_anti-codon: tRNA-synt_2: GAD [Tuwongella imm
MSSWQRTHNCGELRETHIGSTVTLNGWVHTYRDHGSFVFIDLRDRYGLTQIVFEPERGSELFTLAQSIRSEWVLSVTGTVANRLPGKEKLELPTGKIELKVESLEVLNKCPTPPFEINEFVGTELANEDLRLKYRFLDLRRQTLQRILRMRHTLNKTIHHVLDASDFIEVETPILGKSSPEGARDYLVPSRVFPGEWYALPQSPQLYKQLLMVSGYDKYYQIARCLRDEDLRADRQPEFTQLDMEMSFVEMDDIFRVIENLTVEIFQNCLGISIPTPFPRMPYSEAMSKYGSDKPDLRYGLEIVDLGDIVESSDFKVFKDTIAAGKKVRGINAKGAATVFSNTELKEKGALPELVKQFGAKGLAWLKVESDKFTGSIEKFFSAEVQTQLRQRLNAEPGDLLLMVADSEDVVCNALGNLRIHLANRLGLVDPTKPIYKIHWVVDFPSFLWDDEEKRWVANHHPFTAPKDEDLPYLESDPGRVHAKAYDLVMNGYEVGGGSIRIHNPEVQSRVFQVLGMDQANAEKRFGFLLDALKHGAPPHGGIALGLDRWIMLLAGTTNIRDVIAFPKNQRARDLMTGAPGTVDRKQLKELGL